MSSKKKSRRFYKTNKCFCLSDGESMWCWIRALVGGKERVVGVWVGRLKGEK